MTGRVAGTGLKVQEYLSGHALLFGGSWVGRKWHLLTLHLVERGLVTSDNRTAALARTAALLLFLGVEDGEDGFIENRLETFLRQC